MNVNDGYYNQLRPEILKHIPDNISSVLDVGCGYGTLGKYLKERGVSNVCGIELDTEASKEAEKVLDCVVSGNIEGVELPFSDSQFDCIVCADVLEHLIDPWSTLKKLKKLLKDDGCIIASIPNVGFHRVVRGLIKGEWKYSKSGVLDITHLRFFTLSSIQELFNKSKLQIRAVDRKIYSGWNMKILNMFLMDYIKESLVIQYIIVATK